ncbi:MAG: HepT-like ribonuclease domain-containing protein [bacterium]
MLDAAEEAMGFARGRKRSDLNHDRQLVLALVKDIEIIGEAAHQTSDETRAKLPEIPWDDIIGMRHRLVHAYFDINLDILWQTVQNDLPPLVERLGAYLSGRE